MKNKLPLAPLSEVLSQYQEYIQEPEVRIYPKLSVKLYGKGVVLDGSVDGSTLKMRQHQIAKGGQVILSEIWGKKGAIGFVPPEGEGALCTSHFFLFDVRKDKIEPKYLQAIFTANFLEEQLNTEAKGTTGYAAVRPKHLLAAKIPLPSLEEQCRIVARVEELAARIEEARGLRRKAVEEVEMLLALSLKKMRKELLTSSYSKDRIGHITQVSSGGTPSREILSYWNGNIPWIKTGELLDGDIFQAEEHITEEGLANSAAKLFPLDTVLVALYGQGQTRGRTGRLMIEVATNQAGCAILPTPAILDPRFTQYWLRSLYLEMREVVRDGAQPNWNGQMIKNIEIALPPLLEQKRIVNYLDNLQSKVDPLKQLQSETSAELDALLPSVLDKAFKGEL